MPKTMTLLLIGSGLLWASCRNPEHEQQLARREQLLLEKEKQFALKEADYQTLINMRDSLLALRDVPERVLAWPDTIAGQWTSRVICTESTCPDYVIGDQRADVWEFSSDSTQIVTKVLNGQQLVRIYTAGFDGRAIDLRFKTDSAATKQVDMNVVLNAISPTKMKGTRSVTVNDQCNAKFTVELSRIPANE